MKLAVMLDLSGRVGSGRLKKDSHHLKSIMTRRRTVREFGSGVHILEEVVGIGRLTCIQILDDPDSGDLWQLINMLGKEEYSHLEVEIRETIRRKVRDWLRRRMKGL